MIRVRSFVAIASLSLLTASLLSATVAAAAPPEDAKRAEARERFDRGLTLFNQGDNEGALAEFQRAFQLTGNGTVLYNIGRVQAASGDPVSALQTLDQLSKNPAGLSAERRKEVESLRLEQENRVGSVALHCQVPVQGRLEVDGVDSGAFDASKPLSLSLAAGRHVVGLLIPGYYPVRETVSLAGREQKQVELSPQPLAGALGRIKLSVEPIGVMVKLDDQELGRTPHLLELAVAPGPHHLRLERPGYAAIDRDVTVREAGVIEVSETLTFDAKSRTGHDGFLSVHSSEPESVIFINGTVANDAGSGVSLPEGEHRLRVERGGFVTSERLVTVPRGSSAKIDVTLAPTAQYRADYSASVASRHNWALGIAVGGVAVAAASGGYLIWATKQVNQAEARWNEDFGIASEHCNMNQSDCKQLLDVASIRQTDLSEKQTHQTYGYVGLGVGLAAVVTGVVLRATGPDKHRYDPRPESDVFGSLELSPWALPGSGGLVASGSL